ncbi:MAG: NblA/ycf18 family protein [Cyanobacteria bacterium P01_C01_bin.120]
MDQTVELTLEQEFMLKDFAFQVQKMSLEQAREFLIDQHRNMLIQKLIFQNLLKHEWNLDPDVDLAIS